MAAFFLRAVQGGVVGKGLRQSWRSIDFVVFECSADQTRDRSLPNIFSGGLLHK